MDKAIEVGVAYDASEIAAIVLMNLLKVTSTFVMKTSNH